MYKFNVGDSVKVINSGNTGHPVGAIGKITRIDANDGDMPYLVVTEGCIKWHREHELELYGLKVQPKFNVGDSVRIIASDNDGFPVGTKGKITEYDGADDNLPYRIDTSDDYYWHSEDELALADEMYVEPKASFNVGDRVEIIQNTTAGYNVGYRGIVTSLSNAGNPIIDNWYCHYPCDLKLVMPKQYIIRDITEDSLYSVHDNDDGRFLSGTKEESIERLKIFGDTHEYELIELGKVLKVNIVRKVEITVD